jgi:hypothetical protein
VRHINRHVFVNAAGSICSHNDRNWDYGVDWRSEAERGRQRKWERDALPTTPAPEPARPGYTPPMEPLAENVLHAGSVRQWYAEKRFGLVNADARGRRYQIPFAADAVGFDHALLEPGLRVQFYVAPDPEGRLRCTWLLLE